MKNRTVNPKGQIFFAVVLFFYSHALAQSYPDQFYVLSGDDLNARVESTSGIRFDTELRSFVLEDSVTSGIVILDPAFSEQLFNRGLPSWNGTASGNRCSFKIQMRFPYADGWSPWLTVGFWKAHIGGSYGVTSYSEGYVDIDYVKLSVYRNSWQFRILMTRLSYTDPSPSLNKICFFVSDSRTTDQIDYLQILNDNPAEIYVPTEFYYQYAIDDVIGGSICSPTSVSMALRSYDISVDPYQFALDTYDPYWGIFGVWPRVVQNASEFGLDGAVTRYRTWSEARDVLANNGRIVMSVGLPLYSGHLMMLGGFDAYGTPLVHDPARSNGYGYIYSKSQLSQSWFGKGGIAYTFYLKDSVATVISQQSEKFPLADNYILFPNYPNPFNAVTNITFQNALPGQVRLSIYDMNGRIVASLLEDYVNSGNHSVLWDASGLPSGTYFISLHSQTTHKVIKAILLK